MEILALEKLKNNAEQVQITGEVEHVDEMLLITHMHKHKIALKKSRSCSSVPIADATDIIPNYRRKAQINNVKHSMKLENLNRSCHQRHRESGKHRESSILAHSQEYQKTSPESTLSAGITQVNLNLGDGNHLPTKDTSEKVKSVERPQSDIIGQQPHKLPENFCSVIEPRSDLGSTEARVQKLVVDLNSNSLETIRAAIGELRCLARLSTENQIMIAEHGAITILVKLLYSTDAIIQEHAVTTLLNLSIYNDNKISIAQANAIEPLIHVLDVGSPEAKQNSAATLFSLSMVEENKVKIGRSGAIGPLVELLGNGTPRGRKDATTALFYLSMLPENKVRIVQARAVRHLVELMDPSVGMVDKAVAVLANLATIQEGRVAIGREGGIPVLVEAIELGSARGKENAAAALLRICSNSDKFCIMALQEGVIPPLVALLQSGTRRGKDKAQDLLNIFRKHVYSSADR